MSREQKQPYVRFFASDWLGGTRGMKANEVGVYITLIAMMYERCEPLPEDHRYLGSLCGCAGRTFKKACEFLIKEGHIIRIGGFLWSPLIERWKILAGRQPIPAEVRRAVEARDGEQCRYCGSEDGPFHIDHVLPVSLGGQNITKNLVVSCAYCNLSKGAKPLSEWLQ